MMRPSSLPALWHCPSFRPGEARQFTHDGTLRHSALQSKFDSATGEVDPKIATFLDDESLEAIEWAYDYIRLATADNDELKIEDKMDSNILAELGIVSGTIDYHWRDQIFDFKWRERNYSLQLAAYAIQVMEAKFINHVRIHILYGETRNAVSYILSLDDAISRIKELTESLDSNPVKYRWNSYCGWCDRKLDCPLIGAAIESTRRHPDFEIQSFNLDELRQNEEQMARALHAARVLSKWAEAVKEEAVKMAREGVDIPGNDLRMRSGNQYIEDIKLAFMDSGLDEDTFLECCKVSFPKLAKACKAINGISDKAARNIMAHKLGRNLKRGAEILYLQAKKDS